LRRLPSDPLRDVGRLAPQRKVILKITAFIDGAARGNPGPAGYGVHMTTGSGEIIEICGYLGRATNNVAEYAGLLEALETAREEGAAEVEVVSDSELLVKQMLGIYRVKHPNLIPMYKKAKELSLHFSRFSIRHTLRAGNKEADRLANLAVDRGEGRLVERRHVQS
jgi:ribonuclease HI